MYRGEMGGKVQIRELVEPTISTSYIAKLSENHEMLMVEVTRSHAVWAKV